MPAKNSNRITPFARRVYEALRLVPEGFVTTYGALARRVGCGSAQAVGQALKRNPLAPGVPCHRVIAADGSPGGFRGRSGGVEVRRKLALLEREGVHFRDGFLENPQQLMTDGKQRGRYATT